jgi:hypothetical protein
MGIGDPSSRGKVGVRLITHLHLVPRLRIRQFVFPLALYSLMAWGTKTTLPLPLLYQNINNVWCP